jgi:hypothetical protein
VPATTAKYCWSALMPERPSRRRVTITSFSEALQAKWMDYSDQGSQALTMERTRQPEGVEGAGHTHVRLTPKRRLLAARIVDTLTSCDGERHRSAPRECKLVLNVYKTAKTTSSSWRRCLQSWRKCCAPP